MAFNLTTFRQQVHSVARNQYFIVRIPQVGKDDIITALARTTELPAVTHNTLAIPYRGLEMKIDDRPQFGEWSVNFLCDEAHALRNVFLKWMSKAYNIQNLRTEAHNTYKQDGLSVSQIASTGLNASTVTFIGAWPTNVGAVSFDQAGGGVVQFDVTFTYDYFVMNDLKGDVVVNDLDIDVDNDGRMTGVTIKGMAGVSFNLTAPA
jgi:hypothetical protein